MDRQTLRRAHRRHLLRTLLAGLLAGTLLLLPGSPPNAIGTSPSWLGIPAASAQGPMDIGIRLPSFSDLPLSVLPGQSFPLVASTAPGAQCIGHLTFRGFPTIDFDPQTTPDGACSWTVDVPPTARPGTATI